MTELKYEVVRHDEGWAYKVGDVFSERFATHDEARLAAEAAAARQQLDSVPADIEYEGRDGKWHTEHSSGADHPDTAVVDDAASGSSPRD